MGVCEGVGVCVGVYMGLGLGVCMGVCAGEEEGVNVCVGVGVNKGASVGKGVSEGVGIGVGVDVGVCVGRGVGEGIGIDAGAGVSVCLCVCMNEGGDEGLSMCLCLGMDSGLGVSMGVCAGMGVGVGMDEGVSVGLCVRMVEDVSLVVDTDVGVCMGWSGHVRGVRKCKVHRLQEAACALVLRRGATGSCGVRDEACAWQGEVHSSNVRCRLLGQFGVAMQRFLSGLKVSAGQGSMQSLRMRICSEAGPQVGLCSDSRFGMWFRCVLPFRVVGFIAGGSVRCMCKQGRRACSGFTDGKRWGGVPSMK
eukprot:6186306-Pleurochrysis_carterae.AAC.2